MEEIAAKGRKTLRICWWKGWGDEKDDKGNMKNVKLERSFRTNYEIS